MAVAGGGGGIVFVIIITQPIKTDPLLVKTTSHNSPHKIQKWCGQRSDEFLHTFHHGWLLQASEGLLVAVWSLDRVGARPALLNFFALNQRLRLL